MEHPTTESLKTSEFLRVAESLKASGATQTNEPHPTPESLESRLRRLYEEAGMRVPPGLEADTAAGTDRTAGTEPKAFEERISQLPFAHTRTFPIVCATAAEICAAMDEHDGTATRWSRPLEEAADSYHWHNNIPGHYAESMPLAALVYALWRSCGSPSDEPDYQEGFRKLLEWADTGRLMFDNDAEWALSLLVRLVLMPCAALYAADTREAQLRQKAAGLNAPDRTARPA